MIIVKPGPIPNPAAAQGVTTSLWGTSQTYLCRVSLWTLSYGDGELHIGVSSSNPAAELQAVRTISLGTPRGMEEAVEASSVIQSALADSNCHCISVTPQARDVPLSDEGWWRQNNDPLYPVQMMIERTPGSHVAGSVLTFRAYANGITRACLTVFATGPQAKTLARDIATQYKEVGVKPGTVPFLQRRALARTLSGQLRRPAFSVKEGALEVYWHPPFLLDPRRVAIDKLVV